MRRRAWSLAWLGSWAAALAPTPGRGGAAALGPPGATEPNVRRGRTLHFPRDHGAHPEAAIEWWYLTGWLAEASAPQTPRWGVQITFFRRRTGLAEDNPSRFAARQLLFAHAALTDLAQRRHEHLRRVARWDGRSESPALRCATADADLRLQDWQLRHEDGRWRASMAPGLARTGREAFALELQAQATQPLLLQGEAGFSRKGPGESHASHYLSWPQLRLSASLQHQGRREAAQGMAWLDHEWSDALMPPEAVGWDWIGINGFDGSALTAFRLRRGDGSVLWAGGSLRSADGRLRVFAADELRFEPLRHWQSPSSQARYPVHWRLHTPAGTQELRALLDAQELDQRQGMGLLYWEGLSELLDPAGRRIGLGYLEMTGYRGALRVG